ncbi:methyl-accepting chemotaxis protein [Neptuniibacter sp. QD29_5]|uniref:methyl-accepting chemotaxis protein n=1 Tax=Neptuniibacter sp. QD29_5 TaxID=3398207 RepID=UPI0039F508A3
MSIRRAFILVSLLVIVAMAAMTWMLWQTSSRISGLGQQYAVAKGLTNDMLMLRRHEKDFLLRKQLKYVDKFEKRIALMRDNIDSLASQLTYAPEVQKDLGTAQHQLDIYQQKLIALVELDKKIGLDKDSGLRGAFNQAERTLHQKVANTGDSLAISKILHLILLENDFQNSYDLNSKTLLRESLKNTHNYMQQVNLPAADSVKTFEDTAHALAEALQQRGLDQSSGLRGELRSSIHEVESIFGGIYTDLEGAISSALSTSRMQGVGMATALTIVIAGLLLWQTFRVLNRLQTANSKMSNISHGGGDLTQHLDLPGEDEVTELAHSVNDFIDTTAGLVREIKEKGETVESSAHHSVELSKRSQTAIEEQRNNTIAVNQAVQELVTAVELIASSSTQVQDSVSSADQQMNEGSQIMAETHQQMEKLTNNISRSSDLMHSLSQSSTKIDNVIGVIRDITEQTNLLALNAAIEAARAGDKGRGFAVVADEVRTLAQRTQSSTVEIESMIETLQQHVTESEVAMQSSLKLSETMNNSIGAANATMQSNKEAMDKIREMVIQIAGATEEQMYTVKGVEDATQRISSSAEQLLSDSCESCRNCECLETQAHQMREDVSKFIV